MSIQNWPPLSVTILIHLVKTWPANLAVSPRCPSCRPFIRTQGSCKHGFLCQPWHRPDRACGQKLNNEERLDLAEKSRSRRKIKKPDRFEERDYSSIFPMISAASRTSLGHSVVNSFFSIACFLPSGVLMSSPSNSLHTMEPLRDLNASVNSLTRR